MPARNSWVTGTKTAQAADTPKSRFSTSARCKSAQAQAHPATSSASPRTKGNATNGNSEKSARATPIEVRYGPPAPAEAFLTKPHQISGSEVYMRTETSARPSSARRTRLCFTSRASSRSSATRSKIAACPPTAS